MTKVKLVTSLLVLSVCVAGPGLSINAGVQTSVPITNDHQKLTYDCKGRSFLISGDSNEITLNGECEGVMVSGDGNKIDVEAVAMISATGEHNRITWQRGKNGKNPKIVNPGTQNVVSQKKK